VAISSITKDNAPQEAVHYLDFGRLVRNRPGSRMSNPIC